DDREGAAGQARGERLEGVDEEIARLPEALEERALREGERAPDATAREGRDEIEVHRAGVPAAPSRCRFAAARARSALAAARRQGTAFLTAPVRGVERAAHLRGGEEPEAVAYAARDDGRKKRARARGHQDEALAGGRLLERFQERVGGALSQRVRG